MSNRRINLNQHPVPDARVTEWLEANDVHPGDVAAASYALIVEEKLLVFIGIERADGQAALTEQGNPSVRVVIKTPLVAPMLSAPENHGL